MISGNPIVLETDWSKQSDNFSAFGLLLNKKSTKCYQGS